jgi:hypothetical protein
MELIFEIRGAEEGGFCARALGHAIFTEAETWEELRANVPEAVGLHFKSDAERPRLVQLHYVNDELLSVCCWAFVSGSRNRRISSMPTS